MGRDILSVYGVILFLRRWLGRVNGHAVVIDIAPPTSQERYKLTKPPPSVPEFA